MRVAVSSATSTPCSIRDEEHYNLRVDPAAMERIEGVRRHLPLRNLLVYLNASDSIFSTFGSKVWNPREEHSGEPFVFASRVDLVFLREDANFGAGPHEDLVQRLAELLEREPGDALRVELQIVQADFGGENRGFCLRVLLRAKGTTSGQAELRWGLGLARLQQALLFV